MIRILKSKIIHKGQYLIFNKVDFLSKSKTVHTWEYVSRTRESKAVVIIPFIEKTDNILLIKQYRYPTRRWTIEFPAGLLNKNETPIEGGMRELLEETGYVVTKLLSPCIESVSSPGMSSEKIIQFSAYVKKIVDDRHRHLDDAEQIDVLVTNKYDLLKFLNNQSHEVDIDSKVLNFAIGMNLLNMEKQ